MKFLYCLEGTSGQASALVIVDGFRGSYRFIWNDRHRCHIFEGRELEAEEFNRLANDLYVGVETRLTAVVPRVVITPQQDLDLLQRNSELEKENALLKAEAELNARVRNTSPASQAPPQTPETTSPEAQKEPAAETPRRRLPRPADLPES